ncbi:MAG: polyprenyl synthetase family protein [Anaerolineales bacterium]|jgi:geranylgeranyl pyrophosphate synthase|nr:polyprenyl synthetase family protein [Anaerolineales bacterium]MBX3004415.1 polyprenyl synthetase family protein [Anaerolineales bacterium]MCW5838348.1 polyprenyl synthetase family protein [Anaerolineales bacterium]
MTMLDFHAQVQTQLPEVEERMRRVADGYHPELGHALEQLLGSGGKRVRPTVTLLVAGMLDAPHAHAVTVAAAVEMLHTATLVHDDLIDGATLRRGEPTLNALWNSAATILAGDFLFSQAAWLGAQAESVDVMQMFAKTLSIIVNGEVNQIFTRNTFPTRAEYDQRIYAKTASMFELAAKAPAHLAGVFPQYGELLNTYGNSIGMAFQVVDDVLDFSSDEDTLGKPAASDLRHGLVTLPTLYYLDMQPGDARVAQLLQGDSLQETEIDTLIADIRSSGALQQANEEAHRYVRLAQDALQSMPACAERDGLADLAEYVVERLH